MDVELVPATSQAATRCPFASTVTPSGALRGNVESSASSLSGRSGRRSRSNREDRDRPVRPNPARLPERPAGGEVRRIVGACSEVDRRPQDDRVFGRFIVKGFENSRDDVVGTAVHSRPDPLGHNGAKQRQRIPCRCSNHPSTRPGITDKRRLRDYPVTAMLPDDIFDSSTHQDAADVRRRRRGYVGPPRRAEGGMEMRNDGVALEVQVRRCDDRSHNGTASGDAGLRARILSRCPDENNRLTPAWKSD